VKSESSRKAVINPFRAYFHVTEDSRFHTEMGENFYQTFSSLLQKKKEYGDAN
jgi:hypothetical protein